MHSHTNVAHPNKCAAALFNRIEFKVRIAHEIFAGVVQSQMVHKEANYSCGWPVDGPRWHNGMLNK